MSNKKIKHMKKTLSLLALLLLIIGNIQAQCYWKSVSISGRMGTGIKTDGTLWVWGDVVEASLNSYSAFPVQVGTDNDWKSVSTGSNFRLAIKNNGTLWAWGSESNGYLGNGYILPNASTVYQPTQVGTDADWKSVDCHNALHTLAIKENGTLWVWGIKNTGALGVPSNDNIGFPTQIGTDTDWLFASVGFCHVSYGTAPVIFTSSFAIKNDGSLWTWGYNYQGTLGMPTFDPIITSPILINTINNVISVTSYHGTTLAIKSDGTLWGSGVNLYGELGDGTTTSKPSFIQIGTDTNWFSVSKGKYHSLATKTDGTLWTWGNNQYGVLGTGNNIYNSFVPTQVGTETNWSKVTGGNASCAALKTDDSIWAWGLNTQTVLGIGMESNNSIRNYPTIISCNGLGINSNSLEGIKIYPNPVQDILLFDFNQNKNVKKRIIFDLLGKKVIEQNDNSYGEIYVGELKPGIYLMKIYVDDTIYQQKFIKE